MKVPPFPCISPRKSCLVRSFLPYLTNGSYIGCLPFSALLVTSQRTVFLFSPGFPAEISVSPSRDIMRLFSRLFFAFRTLSLDPGFLSFFFPPVGSLTHPLLHIPFTPPALSSSWLSGVPSVSTYSETLHVFRRSNIPIASPPSPLVCKTYPRQSPLNSLVLSSLFSKRLPPPPALSNSAYLPKWAGRGPTPSDLFLRILQNFSFAELIALSSVLLFALVDLESYSLANDRT